MSGEIMAQFLSYLSIIQNFNHGFLICLTCGIQNKLKRLLKDIKIPNYNEFNPFFLLNNSH